MKAALVEAPGKLIVRDEAFEAVRQRKVVRSLGESNSAKSFAPVKDMLTPDKPDPLIITPVGGRSSDGNMPFFNLDAKDGEAIIAIGWSGQWKASFQQAGGRLFKLSDPTARVLAV